MKEINRRDFIKGASIFAITHVPAIDALSKILNGSQSQTSALIDCAFRLSDSHNLLNLEFYFINVEYKDNFLFRKRKLIASYGQEESYMIVRLPQQHIAEQAYDASFIGDPSKRVFDDQAAPISNWTALTRISGYSYLVFRIQFQKIRTDQKIILSEETLLDWNNKDVFKLVVRQNLNQPLFDIEVNIDGEVKRENLYPFNYSIIGEKPDGSWERTQSTGSYKRTKHIYDYDAFPKVYGDPITALEIPWRLFLSPKLPDQDRFEWHWQFSKKPVDKKDYTEAELWYASLTIKENQEYLKQLAEKKKNLGPEKRENALKNELDEVIKQIELMILGTPGSAKDQDAITENFKYIRDAEGYFIDTAKVRISEEKDYSKLNDQLKAKVQKNGLIVPNFENRRDLVNLYIKYKLIARTERITFSPLGVSTFIEFKNEKIEETSAKDVLEKIFLVQWKQLISLGRDEEVEVVTLIMDKETGLKYLRIESSKRRTKKGLSYLDYREYIMPLTTFVDYQNHTNLEKGGETISKFKSPFKSLEIKELKPKRICPLGKSASPGSYTTNDIKFYGEARIYYPLTYNKLTKETETLTFQHEATDWQEKKVKFEKVIQAIELSVTDEPSATITSIDAFFDKELISTRKSQAEVKKAFDDALDSIKSLDDTAKNNFSFFKKRISEWNSYLINESLLSLYTKAAEFSSVIPKIDDLKAAIYDKSLGIDNYLNNYKAKAKALTDQVNLSVTNSVALREEIHSKVLEIATPFERLHDVYNHPEGVKAIAYANPQFKLLLDDYTKKVNTLKDIEKKYRNQIKCFQQHVAFSVKNIENVADQKIEDTISNLKSDFLLFRGELKALGSGQLDFFNRYSSLPQMEKAQVYVNSLNKIVNEKIPVEITYAEDYVKNQLNVAKLDIDKNAAKVFAEITESSQQLLKGKIRDIASDLGGYINPEIPAEYITYLKDPRKIPEKLKSELMQELGIQNQFTDSCNDLVFIGKEAKKNWNEAKQITPESFFKDLEAKVLGSIKLNDILGLDFEMPRLSEKDDKVIYSFSTDKITDKDLRIVKFYSKNKMKPASLQIFLEKNTKNISEYKSFTALSDFTLSLRPLGGADVLLIRFNKLKVSSSNVKSKSTEVKINDVAFGGPLNFLAKLAEAIKIPGTGLRIKPSLSKIDIGYAFAVPSIEAAAFNLSNLKFDIGLNIPFPNAKEINEITTKFNINNSTDKFLVSVGIFGGRGHFELEATPQKIQRIDASIEFGGYLGLNLGIASGHVYLFAGIRYRCSGKDIAFTGYLTCGGGVTVFGFISVSVTFIMALEYQNIGGEATLYGSASVSYSIKIGFFKKSFTLSYSKRITGTKGRPYDPEGSSAFNTPVLEAESMRYAYIDNFSRKSAHGPSEYTYIPKVDKLDYSTSTAQDYKNKSFSNIYTKQELKEYYSSFHF